MSKQNTTTSSKYENLIGPTDPKIDHQARERLVTARVGLVCNNGMAFFGNLATRMPLTNADEWCGTAATDGRKFYYNSRFIMKLSVNECKFLVAHEILHCAYDHFGRRGDRDPQLFNIANDYAINADLKRHKVGQFITSVPCLYEAKYDGKSSEEIYADLYKNAEKIDVGALMDKMIDDHLEGAGEGDGENEGDGDGKGKKGRPKMSQEEIDSMRQEMKQAIIAAARSCEAGTVPIGVEKMIKDFTEPKMPWRELIPVSLTSAMKSDYSWSKPSRRGWHVDAILPGMTPGEEIEVTVAIDMSVSISTKQAQDFLGEIKGMMESFDGYKVTVFSFDTKTYNFQSYNSDSIDTIEEYVPKGGGGTDFDCIFSSLKERGEVPKRLIVFTDGYPCGSWGDPDYTDTIWIIHGDKNPNPPFGTWALYD